MNDETYAEWAETDLVWGNGMFNWCRFYTKEEYKPKLEDDQEILNHPLNSFG